MAHAGLGGDGEEVGGGDCEEEAEDPDQEKGVEEGEVVEVGCYYAGADSVLPLVWFSRWWSGEERHLQHHVLATEVTAQLMESKEVSILRTAI